MDNIQPNKMRGITLINMLFVAMLVIFGAVIAINLVPPFIEHYQVKDALNSLASDPSTAQLNKGNKDLFMRRVQIDNIKAVTADNLEITKKDDKMLLKLSYEVRVHVIGNMDGVLKFNDEVIIE